MAVVVGVEVEVAIVDPFRDVFLIGTFTIGLRRPELLDIDHVRCAPATEASLPLPLPLPLSGPAAPMPTPAQKFTLLPPLSSLRASQDIPALSRCPPRIDRTL